MCVIRRDRRVGSSRLRFSFAGMPVSRQANSGVGGDLIVRLSNGHQTFCLVSQSEFATCIRASKAKLESWARMASPSAMTRKFPELHGFRQQ